MTRIVILIAQGAAVLGGLVLTLLIALTTLSIIGRSLNDLLHGDLVQSMLGAGAAWLLGLGIGEINGTYELLEAGVAFAIFAAFPICQIYGAHATVDVFTTGLSPRTLRGLRAFWEVILSVTIIFITWRLFEGMQRFIGNGQTTLFLQFPVWWSYAASFAAATVASFTAAYCAALRVAEALTGRDLLPVGNSGAGS